MVVSSSADRTRWFLRFVLVVLAGVAAVFLATGPLAANALPQGLVVSDDPVDYTPNILDGHVTAITTIGDTVIVGGTFTEVKEAGNPTVFSRNYIFAFDRLTGDLDPDFVPVLDNVVDTLAPAPDGTSVFVGGKFANVNGTSNFGLAKLDVATGAKVAGFNATTAGRVRDAVVHGNTLYIGGDIWSVNGFQRSRLAAVDAATGAVDQTFTVGTTEARVSVDWVAKLDVSPDGSKMVIIGNFVEVDNLPREQIAVIDLSGPTAVVDDWSTDQFAPGCSGSFWTYMRDIEYEPQGEFFVVATTGGPYTGTLCDTASRWESAASGSDLLETWADWSGGDTLTAVAVSDVAVYIGGHQRWMNNHLGRDTANIGAVSREGIVALDPINGVPYSWNPSKARGVAVWDLHLSDQGLYVGSDTDFTANEYHAKLAQFPLDGGTAVPVPTPASLPTDLYAGDGSTLTTQTFDGAGLGAESTVGGNVLDFDDVLGVFHQAGRIYYMDDGSGDLRSRSFDGITMGAEVIEPSWVDWNDARSAVWIDGRLYYTETGSDELRYQYFSLESGIVGSQTFTVSGNGDGLDWTDTRGLAYADGLLYFTEANGNLSSIVMSGVAPVPGSDVLISGPGVDGRDWSGKDIFFYEVDAGPVTTLTAPTDGAELEGVTVVTADATDDGSVDQVEFFVDTTSLGVDTNGLDGWSVSWDTTAIADGGYTVSATATDDSGQTSSDAVNVTVDNNGPTVTVTAPLDGATVSGTVTATADAADDVGVAGVEFFAGGVSVGMDVDGADGWSVPWDTTSSADGSVALSATATDTFGRTASDAISVTVDNSAGGVVVMVVANPGSLSTGDSAVKSRLEGLGLTVTVLDDDGITASASEGASFVVLSSTINSNVVGATFVGVVQPVWVAKPWSLDDMGMTGLVSGTDFGTTSASTVTIADAGHPLAAGYTGSVQVTTSSKTMSWGLPSGDADIVATAAGRATTFVYQAGDTLASGSTAAGCRITYSLFQSAPSSFTADGWAMFDATALYTANNCDAPPVNTPPAVIVTAPGEGTTATGEVTVTADATDTDGIDQVEFFAGGVSVGVDVDGGDGWSASWDTTAGPDGPVVVSATATDALGATGSDEVNVTVDNLGPSVTLTAPVDGATVFGAALNVSAAASDAVGVGQVEFFADGLSIGVDVDGGNGWSVVWDTTTSNDGPVALTVTATDTFGRTDTDAISVTVDNSGGGVIVMVVGNPASLSAGETELVARTEGLGFTVTLVDDNGVTSGVAAGASFVLVSSTANSNQVTDTFNGIAQPLWVAKPWSFDDVNMTGTAANTDFGTTSASTITIVDAGHPLAAGFTGSVQVTASNRTMSWGLPSGDADIIATANGLATTFVYQAGDTLVDGSTAAGCRITYSLFQSAPVTFTSDAWTMFDTTVAYVANGCS